MNVRLIRFGCVAVAGFAAAAPAGAQVLPDVIGQTVANSMQRREGQPNRCVRGDVETPSARLLDWARRGTDEVMRLYLAAAGQGAPADVSASFHRRAAREGWLAGDRVMPIAAVDDPFARMLAAGTARLGPADTFVLAVDRDSAIGIWPILSAEAAARLGHYRLLFLRDRQRFKLGRVELVEGAAELDPIAQYCSHIGDVEQYRLMQEPLLNDPKLGPEEQTVVD